MSNSGACCEGCAFFFGLVLGAFACWATWAATHDNAQDRAVKAGVAEFVLPKPDSRVSEFRWIVCECETCVERRKKLEETR